MSNVIHADGLEIGYSPDNVLAKIKNLKIKKGEIVSIIGESGIGKTTFLKSIAQLINPLSGNLKVFDNSQVRGRIGYIPQKLGLIKHETVFFNVLEGAMKSYLL